MTLLESDLLAAIKALLESSQAMTGGSSFTADDMVRYQKSNLIVTRKDTW
ncbi:MAG: hypothetical protein WCK54_14895 [Desulfuromonadales bacterium]